MVLSPPWIFPGVGWEPLKSSPTAKARFSIFDTMFKNLLRCWVSGNLSARICSAPITSVVSLNILLPPRATSFSEAMPMAGFAAIPLVGSLPPHSIPKVKWDIGKGTLTAIESSLAKLDAISTPSVMVFDVPPQFCMVMDATGLPVFSISWAI